MNRLLIAAVITMIAVGNASAWTGTWPDMGRLAGIGDKARVVDYDPRNPNHMVCQSENRKSSTTCGTLAEAKASSHQWWNGFDPVAKTWVNMAGAPGVVAVDDKGNVRFR